MLVRDYEATDSCSTLDFKTTNSSEAAGSCPTLDLEVIYSFKLEILKKQNSLQQVILNQKIHAGTRL
jgi:hypothetical protein